MEREFIPKVDPQSVTQPTERQLHAMIRIKLQCGDSRHDIADNFADRFGHPPDYYHEQIEKVAGKQKNVVGENLAEHVARSWAYWSSHVSNSAVRYEREMTRLDQITASLRDIEQMLLDATDVDIKKGLMSERVLLQDLRNDTLMMVREWRNASHNARQKLDGMSGVTSKEARESAVNLTINNNTQNNLNVAEPVEDTHMVDVLNRVLDRHREKISIVESDKIEKSD